MFIDHRYEVLESLGTGSWARVYKVKDVRTDKLYTLKLFQYISSDELYNRFSAEEMHHIGKIEHPNLSRVVDFGHVGDHIYFISDYFEGNTLNHFRFSKNRISLLYELIVNIAYALNALHTQRILHKDLKPENVLYRIENNKIELRLIDYGFSKIESGKDSNLISGTLPYVAPEIYLGQAPSIGSDFYSLGVMLYKLTTGSLPFSVDKINALITGNQTIFAPIFPSELNSDIPPELENFILRLLDRYPENRFRDAEEIIAYINRIQAKQYDFSVDWNRINTLKFNSYIVRENLAHQLLDFIPAVEAKNGKIISVVGGDGLGKDSVLSLFRYHLLSGEYYLFEYRCTRTDHEAFFSLVKEYVNSLSEEELAANQELAMISGKFKRFLFESEKEAKGITQSHDELMADFDTVRSLLKTLVERKPVIFIIRDFQWVHRYTIDFLNFISGFLVKSKVMIILACNDFTKIKQIEHTILLPVPPLTLEEAGSYIKKLWYEPVPDSVVPIIYKRSAGNPHFIREILVDFVKNKLNLNELSKDLSGIRDYKLPQRLVQSVYGRMSRLSQNNYLYLQKLSVVETPLNRELIVHILKLEDIQLYGFLNECLHNELLSKEGKDYSYSFIEAVQRLQSELDPRIHVQVSKKVLSFYRHNLIFDQDVCRGVIRNARIAGDLKATRDYMLRLFYLQDSDHLQEEAFSTILEVIDLDIDSGVEVPMKELIEDMNRLQSKMEITGFVKPVESLLGKLEKIPEIFEKYILLGTMQLLAENVKSAIELFSNAETLALTGKQRIIAWQYLTQIYSRADLKKMKNYLDLLGKYSLPLDMQILYTDRLAVYYASNNDKDKAIKTIEGFFETLPPEHDTSVMIRLAGMHNDLGVFYSDQKNIEEATEHLNAALNIWKRYNIKRYMGLIYNNMADLYLKQGLTIKSLEYSDLAYLYSDQLNLPMNKAMSLLNQAEAMIKLGDFLKAEERLQASQEIMDQVGSKKYQAAVKTNLALARSKIKGFGHYYRFITENEPKLMTGYIEQINPLVKTYFYYLNELANAKKLRRLIRKNVHINYKHIYEEEFYHNSLSLLAMAEKDYEKALVELKTATKFAGSINNNYAIAVFYILQITCYYGLRDLKKANELIEQAKPMIMEQNYNYWLNNIYVLEIKLNLLNPDVPLRSLLRRTNDVFTGCQDNQYYQFVIELYQIRLQILLEMGAETVATELFEEYRAYLDQVTEDVAEDDRQNFLAISHYGLKNLKKFDLVKITSRRKDIRNNWNDLLYNIANVNSVERIHFLIEKGLQQVISPYRFMLLEYSERYQDYFNVQCYNCGKDFAYDAELSDQARKAVKSDNLVITKYRGQNTCIVPLVTGAKAVGLLIVADNNELDFTKQELSILRSIKQHLSALLIRIRDYTQITKRIEKMNLLMQISHNLMRIVSIPDLEQEIVSAAISFSGSSRGFLIKKDKDGNNIYQVHLDSTGKVIPSISGVSKSVISTCQSTGQAVYSFNAIEDDQFKSSISVQDFQINAIFCAPIRLDETIYGFIYLDNMNQTNREMYLNKEIVDLFMEQITVALKNAKQYSAVLQKSAELNAFEDLKNEFMAIVAHELNTPLTTLQGYVLRLKRNLYSDEDEKNDILQKIEKSVKKLILASNDITTMNKYNLTKSLVLAKINIQEILELIHQEVEILSRNRRMFIKIELEKDLPDVNANWEAMHLMIYNLVLNAIRFTNDFGTVVIGARRSAFPQEKINGKDSLVIFIQDNGIGIPEHQLKNVFRKFYELNEIYSHKSGLIEFKSSGLGLGLAISKRITELHHGDIWIKSKEAEGTTVFVSLPI